MQWFCIQLEVSIIDVIIFRFDQAWLVWSHSITLNVNAWCNLLLLSLVIRREIEQMMFLSFFFISFCYFPWNSGQLVQWPKKCWFVKKLTKLLFIAFYVCFFFFYSLSTFSLLQQKYILIAYKHWSVSWLLIYSSSLIKLKNIICHNDSIDYLNDR